MLDDTIRIKIDVKSPNLTSALTEMIRSLQGFQVQSADDSGRADLLIFELGDDNSKDFELIRSLLDLGTTGEVFLISRNSDPALLLQAMRTGVNEFFSQPIKREEVLEALVRLKEKREKSKDPEPVRLGKLIEVVGSKGGVGATTLAANLAVSLTEKESVQSVALVDMNLLFGDVPLFLEIKPSYHWGEITNDVSRLDPTFLMNVLARDPCGVYVLPSPIHLNTHNPMSPKIIENLLDLMQKMFDFVVIDGGQSLDATFLRILKMVDLVLLVSTLSLPCLTNTNKLLKSFYALGYPPRECIRVIINRYLATSEISLKDAAAGIDKKIFWTIPNDYRTTMSSINQGKPLCQLASKAAITKSIRGLASVLIKGEAKKEKKGWKFLKSK
jgi:pilus assembly protein CpaE